MTREEARDILKNKGCVDCADRCVYPLENQKGYCEYADAISMAIEALEEQNWTPVNKGLPDAYEDVFVTDFGGGMATVHEDSCGIYEDTGEKFWFSSQNVTAWMPLPKPYTEDNDEK